MPVFAKLLRSVYVSLAELTWAALAILVVVHLIVSYIAMRLAGETALTGDAISFFYYYMVTATTVGYGDMSPGGAAGRLISVLLVIPGAIAIFTAVLGKIIGAVGGAWRQRMNGQGSFAERSGHTIVVGWQDAIAREAVSILLRERTGDRPPPVLIAKDLETNPMPGEVDYVRTDRLADADAFDRAGIAGAATIIVVGQNDDESLAASLIASAINPSVHIVAHFHSERTVALLKKQAPAIETISSLSPQLVVRAAHDPGSSRVARLLLSGSTPDTAYSLRVPTGHGAPFLYGNALARFRKTHRVTVVGYGRGGEVDLNCADDARIEPGDLLYYIADHRLDAGSIDWQALGGVAP